MKKKISPSALKNVAKQVLQQISRYIWYFNVILFALVTLWAYTLFQTYQIEVNRDLESLSLLIDHISYTKLNVDELKSVYRLYEQKRTYLVDVPEDISSIFKPHSEP